MVPAKHKEHQAADNKPGHSVIMDVPQEQWEPDIETEFQYPGEFLGEKGYQVGLCQTEYKAR